MFEAGMLTSTWMIALTLPYPPSVNKLWRSVRGRSIKSADYRSWEKACEAHHQPTGGSIQGEYRLLLEAQRPDKRRRDLGNLEKASSDMLVHLGVIRDDCDAEEITLRWVKEDMGGMIRLTVEAITEEI